MMNAAEQAEVRSRTPDLPLSTNAQAPAWSAEPLAAITPEQACGLIASRQNVSPKRLVEPAPSQAKLNQLFVAAAAAPDHGQLLPWRFVIVPQGKRGLLAEVFALALIDRDPGATLVQIHAAREKAHRSPLLMLAVANECTVQTGCRGASRLLRQHWYGEQVQGGSSPTDP